MLEVVGDAHGGVDGHGREREVRGADRCARVGEDGGERQRAQVRRLAAHVRARDDAGAGGEVHIIGHGLCLGQQQGDDAPALYLRSSIWQQFGQAGVLAREKGRAEAREHFPARKGHEPVCEVVAGGLPPAQCARAAVDIPEQRGVGEDEKGEVAPRAHGTGEAGEHP